MLFEEWTVFALRRFIFKSPVSKIERFFSIENANAVLEFESDMLAAIFGIFRIHQVKAVVIDSNHHLIPSVTVDVTSENRVDRVNAPRLQIRTFFIVFLVNQVF